MHISLRQLEYFIAIVEEQSFSRAAQRLNVTQPGLSHQFQALERQLGVRLIERVPRRPRLTPAGRAVLPHAMTAVASAQRVESTAHRVLAHQDAELYVATLYSHSVGILPDALRSWRVTHPGARIRLFEHRRSQTMAEAMYAGQADIAIGPRPEEWDGPLQSLGIERFVVVTAHDDPLAREGLTSLSLTSLASREWVHFTPSSGLSDVLDEACRSHGFSPVVVIRTEQASSALRLAAAGLGLTLVPENNVPPHFSGHVIQPDPPIGRELTAYTRTPPDELVGSFITAIADRLLATGPS
ncbi:LysR family transcriptional regulator [Streptomyces capillispiralis]|uniref:DNA-binding transcriptional LysR family regulator n=1 Tax=Streptomyces capillispiralis TaxID=68182 RepID=A0A561SGX1_9ACTN|nr:LysR family transcriptional regulator [Streptomyces capillispiralis]TWF74110.1 DNA-binding transcriptional LysR family regulator [Streptomyces capillispiralis]GHE23971.1 LysR family transcriptional regulator [Streptomyces capillispiralis]